MNEDIENVQLVIGTHLVNIALLEKGSWAICKAFYDEEFTLISDKNNLLVLEY